MAKRSEVVRPDSVIETLDGTQILVASREALIGAAIRAVETMILAGGEFTMSSQRAPTGFQDESVCVAAFVKWQSHSARTSKAEPEPHVEPQRYDEPGPAVQADIDHPEAWTPFDGTPEPDGDAGEDEVDRSLPTAVH